MAKWLMFAILVVAITAGAAQAESASDVIKTSGGDLKITFIGHGSLMFTYQGKVIHVDPYGKLADYGSFPKADLVLITHEHADHLDLDALKKVGKENIPVVMTETCAQKIKGGPVMRNGDVQTVAGIKIEAVPAYNLIHMRAPGQPYHPKGVGNGYVLTFGDKRVYVAGDTENIPETKGLKDVDIAFLPMNLPYTMTPEMVADAAKAFKPKILYPYHTGDTDISKIKKLMKGEQGIELRIRKMK
ncbi:MAG: MBL fold metallo-hydrolase [Desulfomonile tiedjei]|nr:MBL fold metallo-hydrolase [Desulfomonile tiedjei]